jgi:hypothetical protein
MKNRSKVIKRFLSTNNLETTPGVIVQNGPDSVKTTSLAESEIGTLQKILRIKQILKPDLGGPGN